MHSIARSLDDCVINALARGRVRKMGIADSEDQMKHDMCLLAKEATDIIKYYSTGRGQAALENLRSLRNQRLAHRQIKPASATGADVTDEEIETFYQDNSKLARLLLSLVAALVTSRRMLPTSTATTQPCTGPQFVESGQKAIRTIEHLYQHIPTENA